MRVCIAALLCLVSAAALAQQGRKASMDVQNSPAARTKSSVTITANVTNRSRTDVTKGVVVFDGQYNSCAVNFGPIRSQGGSASGSCVLDGYALVAKVAIDAANGTGWYGLGGNGQAFEVMDINLNDHQ